MLSSLRLLFTKKYWRHLSLASTWHEAWLNLRRVHKDSRARRKLRGLAYLIVYPLAGLAYILYVLKTGGVIAVIIILSIALPLGWWLRRRRKQKAQLRIAPQPDPIPPPPPLTPEAEASLRKYLSRVAILHAVLVDRAGSESFLRNKELPPGIEVISRRVHIDLLRRTDIWDELAPPEREAIMMPDGHWELERIHHIDFGMETLRLLRWVFRIDFFLPTVGHQTRGDYALASELVKAPQKLLEANKLISLDSIQTALTAAEQYYFRCLAESIHRGYVEPANDEVKDWATQSATKIHGKQDQDLTIGTKLISEADESELRITTAYSRTRVNFLRWLRALLRQEEHPQMPFRFMS